MISFRWDTFFLSIKKYIYISMYIPTMNYLHPNVQCVYVNLKKTRIIYNQFHMVQIS